MNEKAEKLLRQIMNHNLARGFYKTDFLPPCGGKGKTYDHMDKENPYKCWFSANQTGREWGGLCPDHQKLFDDALLSPEKKVPVWCKDIVFRLKDAEPPFHKTGWWYLNFGSWEVVPNNWDICPVAGCHAPRPEGW